jgi:hypothetical protein
MRAVLAGLTLAGIVSAADTCSPRVSLDSSTGVGLVGGARSVEAEVRRNQSSLIMVYAWQDAAHFNYAHLSVDTAAKQVVHNGMFHVFGGERVRISSLDGGFRFLR